jgi:CheY-like chemotaxis protein
VIEVLLVEDDPGDVLTTREAFKDSRITTNLHVVGDGVSAMDFLRKRGKYAGSPTPDLILLDLNLPGMDGRDVLATVKGDPSLGLIPVVVLTTSKVDEDVLRSYDLQANAYVRKPVDVDEFIEAVRRIDEFFISIVRLPGR